MTSESRQRSVVGLLCIGLAVFFVILVVVYVDRTYLDPGGRGFGGEANDACASHEGVRYINAHQGTIVCLDGWAAED